MYKILIRPVFTYASETWALSETNERRLSCLKEKFFDVFSERNKRRKHGEKDTVTNYTKHLMNQTSIISKLKVWHGQGT
jgi:hypothetical protein